MSIFSSRQEPASVLRSVIAGEKPGAGRPILGTVKAIAIAVGGLAGVAVANAGVSALRKRERPGRGKWS